MAQCDAIYITDELINSDVAFIQIFAAKLLGIKFIMEENTLQFMIELTAKTKSDKGEDGKQDKSNVQTWFESQMKNNE